MAEPLHLQMLTTKKWRCCSLTAVTAGLSIHYRESRWRFYFNDNTIVYTRFVNHDIYLMNTNRDSVADITFVYGTGGADWIPITGDWDGDGDDTIGIYDPSKAKFLLRNTNNTGAADISF